MSIIFKLDDNRTLKIEIDELKNPIFGGQGRIYFYHNYIIKVLPLDNYTESIPRRFKTLRKACAGLAEDVRKFIVYRGIPLSIAVDFKNYFNFKTTDKALVLLFNFLEGNDLFSYLKNEQPLSKRRIEIYKKLINILISVNSIGIIHGDLYPDNFIVDKNDDVYILDLEGAGILIDRKEWEWKPLVIGKESLFPLPPEIKFKNEFSIHSDIWTGVYLIFFVITGIKPLDFLSRNDHKYLQGIIPYIDKSKNVWPPEISLTRDQRRYQDFKDFYNSIFKKKKLSEILNNTYIKGYLDPSLRPSFEEIKHAINYELDIDTSLIYIPMTPNLEERNVSNVQEESNIQQESKIKEESKTEQGNEVQDKITVVPQEKNNLELIQESYPQPYSKYNKTSIDISKSNIDQTEQEIIVYLKNVPVSTRENMINIISKLKDFNLYQEDVQQGLLELFKLKHTEIIVTTFIKTGDLQLVALFLKFIHYGYWKNFLDSLYKLSRLSGISIYRIIQQKILPIITKIRKKNTDMLEIHKEVFNQIYLSIQREILAYSNKKLQAIFRYLVIVFSFLSFIAPFIMFYVFKIDYLIIAILYPFFLIIFFIISSLVLIVVKP